MIEGDILNWVDLGETMQYPLVDIISKGWLLKLTK